MINTSQIEEYMDFYDEHKDYFVLMEEYSGTEIFKTIISFMDENFPEWKTNKGIGYWAAEFVLTAIQNAETYSHEELNIEELKASLTEDYHKSKNEYVFSYSGILLDQFSIDNEEFITEKEEVLSKKEFNIFYDALFENYKDAQSEVVTYDFISDLPNIQ